MAKLNSLSSALLLILAGSRVATGIKIHTTTAYCPLPIGSRWCTVHPVGRPSFTMAVSTGTDIVSQSICSQGFWETGDISSFGPPGHAVDIGANLGYFTFLLAHAGWKVWAWEPLTTNLARMDATFCANPAFKAQITLSRYALGETPDTCVMFSGNRNVANGVVRCGSEGQMVQQHKPIPGIGTDYTILGTFPVKRLDDVLQENGMPQVVNFAKLDVEGFECEVLRGGKKLLGTLRPQLVKTEIWSGQLQMVQCTREQYMQMYHDSGYTAGVDPTCSTAPTGASMEYMFCRK
mmetsp:Transcript_15143/g.26727  ORF Transcript_15143/g.26727 Transcript_15143/m.26727 type:complete len:292 (-) Transcript_15143:72-947(-)